MFLWVPIYALPQFLRPYAGTDNSKAAAFRLQPYKGSYAKIEAGIQNISVQELLAMKEVFHADLKDFFRTADEDYG